MVESLAEGLKLIGHEGADTELRRLISWIVLTILFLVGFEKAVLDLCELVVLKCIISESTRDCDQDADHCSNSEAHQGLLFGGDYCCPN